MRDEFTWWLERGRPLDLDAVTTVSGDLADLDGAPRVAVVAHHHPGGLVTFATRRLLEELTAAGCRCVLVSTCALAPAALRAVPPSAVVLVRPNEGYDFGSWAVALNRLPRARQESEIVLTNDSMVGPFAPLAPLLARAAHSGTEVWAVTSSLQVTPHLQSYFLSFAPGVLGHPALRRFFSRVTHLDNKVAIVRRHELGLTRAVQGAGLTSAAGFPAGVLGAGRRNPTLVAWRALMERGYPFFKRTLLRDPRVRVPVEDLALAVREIHDIDLTPYLEDLP